MGLSTPEKAAILRACRREVARLQQELVIAKLDFQSGMPGSEATLDILKVEFEFLVTAVRKIWDDHDGRPAPIPDDLRAHVLRRKTDGDERR